LATSITTAAASAMADALNDYIGTGAKLIVYGNDASAPANANAATGSATPLVEFTLDTPLGFTESGGVLTLDTSPALTEAADATGTAAFFRLFQDDGTTVVLQGSVGTSGAELNLNTTSITTGVNVTITSGTITMPTS
jgi:hypothetical protein